MSQPPQTALQAPRPYVSDATHEPGELLYLPWNTVTNDGKGNDGGGRPYVLLNQVGPEDWGTLVYGSRQSTERDKGARVVELHPNGEPDNESEYWYPGIVIPKWGRRLPPGDESDPELLAHVRQQLPAAIGQGTKTCHTPGGFGERSWRGRVIRVSSRVADEIGTDVGVVLTEHAYSTMERWQLMVPLYFEPIRPAWGPVALDETSAWARQLKPDARRMIAGVAATISVGGAAFNNRQIEADTGIVVGDADIEKIERKLLDRLL